ncbi:MAG: MotA/TolQ/ExbB proton channel family protein [Sulfurovum sp.]|jgi:biopolymer transport protein ExbB|nr:MotA/TolQ/ExbB proton channel family protein [Sulfurovum sp.]MDD2400576.1 MotA/TolQ/ExbB proton channel family protein [Sulfurovum sp.]MDD3603051.1 MotA/TolQ/ExbB proton channel family protein [Sulfurovum sp.]
MLDMMHYIDRGGIIVYILIGLNIIGFTIMVWKFIVLAIARWQKEKIIKKILSFVGEHNLPTKQTSMQNAIDAQIKSMEFGLNTVKTIASIAPLLGLLGTVVGVLSAFDAISQQGLGDPAVFSSGISVALITTVAGLIVAIPHYIGYNYFMSLLDKIEIDIEKEVLEQL